VKALARTVLADHCNIQSSLQLCQQHFIMAAHAPVLVLFLLYYP